MRFTLSALEAATAEHLSVACAGALRVNLASLRRAEVGDGTIVTDDQLGELLTYSLCAWDGGHNPGLARVELISPTYAATFEPADAMRISLIAAWLAPTLVEAVAAPLLSGSLMAAMDPRCPTFGVVELVEEDGPHVKGRAHMHFAQTNIGAVDVVAYYGLMCDPAPLSISRRLSGAALVSLGAHLRTFPEGRASADAAATRPTEKQVH